MHHFVERGFMWAMPMLPLAVVGLAVLAGFVALVVWAVRSGRPSPGAVAVMPRTSALDILEQRYARGEIDHDDFEQRRAALGGGPATA